MYVYSVSGKKWREENKDGLCVDVAMGGVKGRNKIGAVGNEEC